MDLSSVSTFIARTIHTDIVGLGSSGSDDTGSVATDEGRFIEWSAVAMCVALWWESIFFSRKQLDQR
jgi:hypothetical protein